MWVDADGKYIYSRAAANGKRAQCQGGAKNPVVVMPDADMEMTTRILADSAFGCAGTAVLAASVAITVGDARKDIHRPDCCAAKSRKTGYGARAGSGDGAGDFRREQDADRRANRQGRAGRRTRGGGGRGKKVEGYEEGYFVCPTVLDEVPPDSEIGAYGDLWAGAKPDSRADH